MKVKELIEKLQQQDPEMEVFTVCREGYPRNFELEVITVSERPHNQVLEMHSEHHTKHINKRDALILW